MSERGASKRENAMETFRRRVCILFFIKRRGERGAKTNEILGALESCISNPSLSTLQKDLRFFAENNIYIEKLPKKKGYRWCDHRDAIDPGSVNVHSALTFLLAKEYFTPLIPQVSLEYLESYFKQSEELLYRYPEKIKRWLDHVRLEPRYFSRQKAEISEDVLNVVHTAIYEGRKITIRYLAATSGEEKIHTLDIMSLVNRESVMELIAISDRSEKPGRYALHRILAAELLNEKIHIPAHFDPKEVIPELLAFPGTGKEIDFRAWIHQYAANQVIETPISKDQAIIRSGEAIIVEAKLMDTIEFRTWLKGLGSYLEVLNPHWLREEIARDLGEALIRYKADHNMTAA